MKIKLLTYTFKTFIGRKKSKEVMFVQALKISKLFLQTKVLKLGRKIENNLAVQNVATYCQLSYIYNPTILFKITFRYIERCFVGVAETKNFLEIDDLLIARIMASSRLELTSEMEVFYAIDSWTSYNTQQRSKHAKYIFSKFRFHLLSDDTLKHIIEKSQFFSENKKCEALSKAVFHKNDYFQKDKLSSFYTHRYCDQDKFNVVLCGVLKEHLKNSDKVFRKTIGNVKFIAQTNQKAISNQVVCLKDEIYAITGGHHMLQKITTVEKYIPETGCWEKVSQINDDRGRTAFCCCAFMNEIYLLGGRCSRCYVTDSCLKFDAASGAWKEVARMSEGRQLAACAVFQGKIVVCGGEDYEEENYSETVECYDVITDAWSPMPSMLESKSRHSAVAVRSKYYVISEDDGCEVFDRVCNKFVALKEPNWKLGHMNEAVSIGSKIFVFHSTKPSLFVYDVDKDDWSEELCEIANNIRCFSCTVIPFC